MRGRRPKPTALKEIEGNPGKRPINSREPKPKGDLYAAPEWMTDSQREGWAYAITNAPYGLLKQLDRSILAIWVVAEDLHREAARGFIGWEEYSILNPGSVGFENVRIADDLPLTAYMGTIGWSGITAYVGLKRYGEMHEGDEVLVSAAAGAVGSVAGQIAKLSGCRVVGTVGSDDKARVITEELGFDGALNYRSAEDLGAELDRHFPDGIDLYFENVGGELLDAVLPRMKAFGRIPVCGMISNYNNQREQYPIRNLWQVLVNRITMRGFLAYEAADMIHEAEDKLAEWVRSGKMVATENVVTGLESTPGAFIRLMSGETKGKTLVRLNDQVSTLDGWRPQNGR